MPSLSGVFNPAIGPLITLFLTPPAVLRQAAHDAVSGPPVNAHSVMALIDTGASITSVTANLAQQVGLPLIAKRPIGTAGGVVPANVYLADIAIPFSTGPIGQPLAPAPVAAVPIPNIFVLEFQCASPHFQMLLGRDILCTGVFHMGFDNRFTFSI